MSLTRATFQPERSELKALELLNMPFMFETLATFHLLMSALNVGLAVPVVAGATVG